MIITVVPNIMSTQKCSDFDYQVELFCLPANCTYALQPLDVAFFAPLKKKWKLVLRMWYRESRLHAVDKAVFPTLLNSLWGDLNSRNLISGFRGAGIFPIDPSKPRQKMVAPKNEVESEHDDNSPHTVLRKAILGVINPPMSDLTRQAINLSKDKRRRVVAESGDIVTSEEVIANLSNKKQISSSRKRPHGADDTLNVVTTKHMKKQSQNDTQQKEHSAQSSCPRQLAAVPSTANQASEEVAATKTTQNASKPTPSQSISINMRERLAKRLGYHVERHISHGTLSTLHPPRRFHRTVGDGNCFFRAVSYALTGEACKII